jgi:hypothetical protein
MQPAIAQIAADTSLAHITILDTNSAWIRSSIPALCFTTHTAVFALSGFSRSISHLVEHNVELTRLPPLRWIL